MLHGKTPEGNEWMYELKFYGYRAAAIKSGGKVRLCSRNDNDFNARYPEIVDALAGLPDDTIMGVARRRLGARQGTGEWPTALLDPTGP
jgi:ATP-dependent DNA ligase